MAVLAVAVSVTGVVNVGSGKPADAAVGSVSTVIGPSTWAGPLGSLAVDPSGTIVVSDSEKQKVWKISPSGVVTTLAGSGGAGFPDGPASLASFNGPGGVAIDPSGNVYVTDVLNNRVRKITAGGMVSSIGSGIAAATDGPSTSAAFIGPKGVAADATGNIYVADTGTNRIRKIAPDGLVSTVAGTGERGSTDGPAAVALFRHPEGVAVSGSGNVYVADTLNHLIRRITPAGVVSTLAGSGAVGSNNGPGAGASFNRPTGVAVDAAENVYVTDSGNHKVRFITSAGVVSTFAGTGVQSGSNGPTASASFDTVRGPALDAAGNLYVIDGVQRIRKIANGQVTTLTASPIGGSAGVAGGDDTTLTVADPENRRIVQLKPGGSLIAFPGPDFLGKSPFVTPMGVTLTTWGDTWIADAGSHQIKVVTWDGSIRVLGGTGTPGAVDGPGHLASFSSPMGIAFDGARNAYVADRANNKIRKITALGVVSTLAGSGAAGSANGIGSAATFNGPTGVAVDAVGNVVVADTKNHQIRLITPAGLVSTLAGSGVAGLANGNRSVAQFHSPTWVAIDVANNVYVTDSGNQVIRRIAAGRGGAAVVSTMRTSSLPATFLLDDTRWANPPAGLVVSGSSLLVATGDSLMRLETETPVPCVKLPC